MAEKQGEQGLSWRLKNSFLINSKRCLVFEIFIGPEEAKGSGIVVRVVGYARVSTAEQDLQGQLKALEAVGCGEVFTDMVSGKGGERPGLDACLASLADGDTLVVWRLDRLGRSLSHLVSLMGELQACGVGVRSLCDGLIDTTTASGTLIFHIFAALAQFERELIRERTMVGLAAAKAKGRTGGRPSVRADNPKVLMVQKLHRQSGLTPAQICAQLGISKATYYRYLKLEPEAEE